ncbi:MAG TPA: three-Cys-motif partner protein TcmP [Thermoanaerobaculia bacterium]|nr:three-Cys-motif partner protein TcmP [Thermoanaerobaculia bacterium]
MGEQEQRYLEIFEQFQTTDIPEPKVKNPSTPVWTENKARLVERYLFLFVLVTHSGTYIDGFAGPQEPEREDMWSAKLVLESRPRWLQRFFLFEKDPKQVTRLQQMVAIQPPRDMSKKKNEPKRETTIIPGDSNAEIRGLLSRGEVNRKQPAFALLDQRTFECEWATLEALAAYNTKLKIELFYFLPNGWLDRALSAQKEETIPTAWWGRNDWKTLKGIRHRERAQIFSDRIRAELGYRSVKPWPIYDKQGGTNVMYYMIHATDYPVAPHLMARAYRKAVSPVIETAEQVAFEFLEIGHLLEVKS